MTVVAPEEIVQAKRNAARARARVDTDVAALQARLHPRTLAQEAIDNVREKTDQLTGSAVGAAKRRPAVAAAAGGAVALLVLRKPLRGLYRLVFRRSKGGGASLTRSERKAAKKASKLNGSTPQSVSAPPDDLIPHAVVPKTTAQAK